MAKWLWAVVAGVALLVAPPSLRAQDDPPPKDPPAREGGDEGDERPAEKTVVPIWNVGDWWKVEYMPLVGTMPKRPSTGPNLARDPRVKDICTFTVEDVKEIDGNRCYVIKAACGADEQHFYRLSVRSTNLTVKLFEDVQVVDGRESVTALPNAAKAFFRLESGTTIPFDFPRFPQELADETLGDTVGNTNVPLVEKATYGPDKKTITFELTAKVNGKEVKSYQKWEAGKPWWVEAKRTVGGQDAEMGKLVDWSGKE